MIARSSRRIPSTRGSCILVLLIAVFVLVLFSALGRGCKGSMTAVNPLPGTGWSIGGVVLRESVEDVKARLGPPDEQLGPPDSRVLKFRHGDVVITTDAAGRVMQVWSRTLMQGSETRVSGGESEEEVRSTLGDTRTEKHYRPKGSGVINTGYVHDSTTFRYRWGADELQVYLYEGTVRAITSSVAPGSMPPPSRRAPSPAISPSSAIPESPAVPARRPR